MLFSAMLLSTLVAFELNLMKFYALGKNAHFKAATRRSLEKNSTQIYEKFPVCSSCLAFNDTLYIDDDVYCIDDEMYRVGQKFLPVFLIKHKKKINFIGFQT